MLRNLFFTYFCVCLQPELDDCMKEDDMEGTTEQRSSLNDANPSKESSRNNENLESKKDDALGTIDNDNEKMDVPIVDIHETVTQTLGSIEFPVDVELAADFEDVAANLDVRYVGSCDTSTRTEDVVTVEALEKNLKARELFDPTKVAEELSGNVRLCDTSIRTEDVVTVDNNNIASEQPEALGENLEARELLDPTRAADDVENSLMEVQANETLQNDTVQAINKLNTVDEEKPEKRRPGRPKMIHLGNYGPSIAKLNDIIKIFYLSVIEKILKCFKDCMSDISSYYIIPYYLFNLLHCRLQHMIFEGTFYFYRILQGQL